eukprot:s3323_g5.t1
MTLDCDALDLLRPPDGWHPDDESPTNYGMICEDDDTFWQMVSDGHFTVRKTTNRKSHKLQTMRNIVESEDVSRTRKLQGRQRQHVSRNPPVGKTWIKQLFAGQMGLTVMAALYGMIIGVPLDSSSSSWDATTPQGLARLHKDMAAEDPYLTVITYPCGGTAAETVSSLREDSKPLLSMVNKVIKDRVKAKRHVFVEQPYGSESIEEPEMADVRALVEDGSLLALKIDGCQVLWL